MANTTDTTFPSGRKSAVFTGDVYRSDTAAKDLFTIPAGSVIVGGRVIGVANSDAGTTATLSVGIKGNLGTEFLSGYDVKAAATGKGHTSPNFQSFGATNSNSLTIGSNSITVTGKYAETGGASTTGGPWTVVFDVLTT